MNARTTEPHLLLRRVAAAVSAAAAALAIAVVPLAASPQEPPEAAPETTTPETASGPEAGRVVLLEADSIVQAVLADYLSGAIAEADETGAELIVIKLSTPGGALDATRTIFRSILGSATPVAVWVAPTGAQAASAGFFILMAADVAAMAPGTNTGAAHPVGPGGEDIEGTMGEKVEQDSAATIRSLAGRHGRDLEAAEAAVIESRSYTADEALELGLIDLVAPSLTALLSELDGREIQKAGRTVTLRTRDAEVVEVEMPALKRVLSALAHPNIAMILLSLGVMGLYFEFQNPGAILPGVLGAIFLILAFFGLSVLPVNYAGVALIILAVLLFIAEIKVPSFGLLTVGGAVSLVLGGMMLFDSPDPALEVSRSVLFGVAVFALIAGGTVAALVLRSRRARVRTGSEGMIGEVGRVVTPLAVAAGADSGGVVRGKVFIQGEIWNAISTEPLPRDAPVRVLAVEGLTLRVTPATSGPAVAGGAAGAVE